MQFEEHGALWDGALVVSSKIESWDEFEISDHVGVLDRISKTCKDSVNLNQAENDIFEAVHVSPMAEFMCNNCDNFKSSLFVRIKEFILLIWLGFLWLPIFSEEWLSSGFHLLLWYNIVGGRLVELVLSIFLSLIRKAQMISQKRIENDNLLDLSKTVLEGI